MSIFVYCCTLAPALAQNNKDQRNTDKQTGQTSGDRVVKKKKQENINNEGNIKVNNKNTRQNGKDINTGGDIRSNTKNTRKNDKDINTGGDIKVNKSASKKGENINTSGDIRVNNGSDRRKQGKEMGRNTGDIVVDNSGQRKLAKTMSQYSGDEYAVFERRKEARKQQKRIANNTGDIGGNYLERRANYRHKKGKEIANNRGDILVKTLNQRARKVRKKNKEIANYQGDIIVTKKKKGMHPSSVYRGGKVKNSYTAKEKYRKRMIKKLRRQKNAEDPNYMRQREKKPKHNKKEAEIWY